MKRRLWPALGAVSLCLALGGMGRGAWAHDVPGTALYLDIGTESVDAEMDLPLSELQLALPDSLSAPLKNAARAGIPLDSSEGVALAAYIKQHFALSMPSGAALSQKLTGLEIRNIRDGDCLVARLHLRTPDAASAQRFELRDDVILHQVVSHKIFVFVRRDFRNGLLGDSPQLLRVLYEWQQGLSVDRSAGSWWHGMRELYAMGMRHIAEGTDHLLFLLTLLLVAPLYSTGRRWEQGSTARTSLAKVLRIVSGFTLGHSLTLALAALGWVQVPTRPVEVLVAVSILASAAHALRPLYAGREFWIASGFGLVHGLAFAEMLSGFGYSPRVLGLSLLSINAGIETMQVLIVAMALPWLLLMARTRWYAVLRVPLALFAATAALAWIGERTIGLANPVAPVVDGIAAHPLLLVMALAAMAIAARRVDRPLIGVIGIATTRRGTDSAPARPAHGTLASQYED